MMHYLANAGGDFANIDKFKLKWNKIDQLGLIDPDHSWNTSAAQPAGYYAADQLIVQGGRWDFQIPEAIAKGNYVLRAETIAIHSSMIKDGTQHYPQCINIEVTEGGSDQLDGGVIGTELYNPTEPGIGIFDAFVTNPVLSNYPIPGPPIHPCGQKGYDQTPHFGSAPKWNGPGSAEPYGLNGDSYPVGKVGVKSPNGDTYGNSPAAAAAAKTTSSATIAATTTTAPAADEYSTTSAPAMQTSAQSVPLEIHSSWTSHSFLVTNATATGTYPTATSVPVNRIADGNSGKENSYSDSGDLNVSTQENNPTGSEHTGGDNTSTPSSSSATDGSHPTSSSSNPTSHTDYNSGSGQSSTTSSSQDNNNHTGSEQTGDDNTSTSTPSSSSSAATEDGSHPTTPSPNPTPHTYDNSGSSSSSSSSDRVGSPSNNNNNNNNNNNPSSSSTNSNPLTDNSSSKHDDLLLCPKPLPVSSPTKVDSSTTPTDESTVAQLLDIIDLCLKKLKAKLANKLRRHARDLLRTKLV